MAIDAYRLRRFIGYDPAFVRSYPSSSREKPGLRDAWHRLMKIFEFFYRKITAETWRRPRLNRPYLKKSFVDIGSQYYTPCEGTYRLFLFFILIDFNSD